MPRKGKDRPATHGPRDPLLDDAALFEQIIALPMLRQAWRKVRANAGAAGGDHVTVAQFARGAQLRLQQLHDALRSGAYAPGPVRTVKVPKRSGTGLRKLTIPCVVDRVAQTAAALVLTPLLDAEFEPSSFGYRPGRSVRQAVSHIMAARAQGFTWVVDADIENYFDSIPHEGLMRRWGESVSDGPLTELVWTWITHAAPEGRGVAQGSPLSPLLANLYLDRLDEAFCRRDMRLVRFADDFVILCRSEKGARQAMRQVQAMLQEHGLRLNAEKSRVLDFNRGFRFLGHLFVRSLALQSTPEQADGQDIGALMRALAREEEEAAAREQARQQEEERQREAGYSPGFRVLHLMSADRRLNVRNRSFVVEEARGSPAEGVRWRELLALPHRQVDRIDIGPRAGLTEEALRLALATDTPVALVGARGETLGWAATQALAVDARRHLAQARVALDADARLQLARLLVAGRLRNQRAVLRRILGERKKAGAQRPTAALRALATINHHLGRGDKSRVAHAPDMQALLGHEGAATAAWWQAIGALAHADFRFGKRREDSPAGVALNFLAWLLARDVMVAVQRAGLHPGFGVLHAVEDDRAACVFDLMEEFRAHFIGGLFVYATNRRILRPEMFERAADGGWRMRQEGARALIRAYESRAERRVKGPRGRAVRWRQLMLEQALALAAHVEGRRTYQPHAMPY